MLSPERKGLAGRWKWVSAKGNNVTANNGTFKIQSVVGSSVRVTVPSGTSPCTSSCGTLWLGTPILGFGPSAGTTYNGCSSGLCSGFGQHIKNISFNCQNLDGCVGWQNLYGEEEEGGADTFVINNYSFVGVDIHGFGAQNFGPVLNGEIYTGPSNTNCDYGTTRDLHRRCRDAGLNGWTINQDTSMNPNPLCKGGGSMLHTPIAAVLLDAMNTEVRNGHCEGFNNCVLIGANDGGASGNHATGVEASCTSANQGMKTPHPRAKGRLERATGRRRRPADMFLSLFQVAKRNAS